MGIAAAGISSADRAQVDGNGRLERLASAGPDAPTGALALAERLLNRGQGGEEGDRDRVIPHRGMQDLC